MSYDRPANRLLVFHCDACGEVQEITESDAKLGDFRECWAFVKELGWAMRNGEHYCPGCAELL